MSLGCVITAIFRLLTLDAKRLIADELQRVSSTSIAPHSVRITDLGMHNLVKIRNDCLVLGSIQSLLLPPTASKNDT